MTYSLPPFPHEQTTEIHVKFYTTETVHLSNALGKGVLSSCLWTSRIQRSGPSKHAPSLTSVCHVPEVLGDIQGRTKRPPEGDVLTPPSVRSPGLYSSVTVLVVTTGTSPRIDPGKDLRREIYKDRSGFPQSRCLSFIRYTDPTLFTGPHFLTYVTLNF